MFSRNLQNYLLAISKEGELALDPADEIVRGPLVTQGGAIVNEALESAAGAA
jgi:hypothetical protein